MHKLRKAAVLLAALSSIGVMAAGTAHADGWGGHKKDQGGDKFGVQQSTSCRSHDENLDVLGEVGILNGALGDALNGEGDAGGEGSHLGSAMGCMNSAF